MSDKNNQIFSESILTYIATPLDSNPTTSNDSNIQEFINTQYTEEFKSALTKFKNITPTIFATYEFFNELPKKTFIYDLFEHLDKESEAFQGDDFNASVSKWLQLVKSVVEAKLQQYDKREVYVSLILLVYFFLQESISGPSFLFIKPTEKVDHKADLDKFENHLFFRLEEKFKCSYFAEYFTIAGEKPYHKMNLCFLFAIGYELLVKTCLFDEYEVNYLWKARLQFLHNKMLPESVFSIRNDGFEFIDKFMNSQIYEKLDDKQKGILLIEKAYYMLKFYKYKENRELLDQAYKALGLNLNLTGIKAITSKYQDEPATVLILENKKENKFDLVNAISNNVDEEMEDTNPDPKNILLDDINQDNPILETPLIPEPSPGENLNDANKNFQVSIYDQLYVAALLTEYKKAFPDEELIREEIKAHAIKCLEVSHNWLVFSKLLIHRSLAEDKVFKTIERSLLQIQSICDQYNDRFPHPYERMKFYFSVDYNFIWDNKRKYASMFMNFGSTMTAYEIFSELEMYDDAINCLYVAGKIERAKELAFSILEKKEDPGIYCVLGEILGEEKYLLKAIEVSKGKYTRAYRCLGHYHFKKGNVSDAINNYEKALSINPLFPSISFTLGCLYMKTQNFQKAISTFSQSLSIEDQNAECWANLGIAFSQVGKKKEALKCIEQGFKQSNSSWKICENLLILSIEDLNLPKLVFAIENMFNLSKYDRLSPQVYYKLVDIFLKYDFKTTKNRSYYTGRMYSIFKKYAEKDGLKPQVWDLYCFFIETVEIKTIEKDRILSNEEKGKIYSDIVEIRMKQLRNLLIADWSKDPSNIIKIKKTIDLVKKEVQHTKILNSDLELQVEEFVVSILNKIQDFENKQQEKIDS